MNPISFCKRAVFAGALAFLSAIPAGSFAADSSPFLLQVTFQRVNFIHTGKLANYTGNQRITFSVFPTILRNVRTGENLLTSPDAFFALSGSAFPTNDPSHSTEYCLNILRSMALTPDSGATLHMFMRVTHIDATNYVVHVLDSCALNG